MIVITIKIRLLLLLLQFYIYYKYITVYIPKLYLTCLVHDIETILDFQPATFLSLYATVYITKNSVFTHNTPHTHR